MGFIKSLFKTPKPPKVQSQEVTASRQAEYNTQALNQNLAANRVNQNTPYGSLTYAQTGTDQYGNPTYTANTSLSPEQQAILNQLQINKLGAGGTAGNLISNTSNMYSNAPDFSNAASSLTTQMLDRQLGYLTPYYTAQRENLDSRLRNQGLFPGTPAYDRAIRTLEQNQNESVGSFLNQAQGQAFNQAVTSYKTPLETIMSLMSMSQPESNLGFRDVPTASINPVDYASINKQYQDALNEQYKQQIAKSASFWGPLGNIAGTILGAPAGSLGGKIGSGLANMSGKIGSGLANMMGLG